MERERYSIVLPIGDEKEAGEINTFIKDLKAHTLIKKDMAASEFFNECFRLGYNEYLKKLYYHFHFHNYHQ